MEIGPREVNKPLILYGYGKLGHLAEEIFTELGIPIRGILDRKEMIVRSWISEKWDLPENSLVAVCVASEPYGPIEKQLKEQGWTDVVPVWDILEFYADKTGLHNGWLAGKLDVEDKNGIADVSNILLDSSRPYAWLGYIQFLRWRVLRDDQDSFPVELATPPQPSTLADIRARQRFEMYPDSKEVNIHAEGKELEIIEQNMGMFKKCRPVIACACYHSRDGLWKIQKTLMDNLPNYRWSFRLTAYMGQSAYLYGTPEEKLDK